MRRGYTNRARVMAAPHPTEARFPAVPLDAGHYESFYLKACHPAEPLGVWIRYTVHKRPGAPPNGSLWVTLFDGAAEGPRAHKETRPAPVGGGADWIAVGDAAMRAGAARWLGRRRRVGPALLELGAAAVPPAARVAVPHAAAPDEAAEPGAGGPLRRVAAGRRAHRSQSTAGAG